jgi:hypothetical protein
MGWGLVFAGVSAAAGAFGAFDSHNSNRQIRQDLDKIKKYIVGLQRSVDEIKAQNSQILQKLDLLPEKIRQIVTEIVDVALLRERYSVTNDIRDNFLILRGGRGYNIRDTEWLKFSDAMSYLFEYEYRLSKTFDLINICEIALVITKERALSLVVLRIDQKIQSLMILQNALQENIESKLDKLKIDLDNKSYISEHNLTTNLDDFGKLTYTSYPNRVITQQYTERVCHYESNGGGGGRYGGGGGRTEVCVNVIKTREIPDSAFHISRDKHLNSIKEQVSELTSLIKEFSYLVGLTTTLKKYRAAISNESSQKIFDTEKPMYFFETINEPTDEKKILKSLDWNDVDDYIDGCHGDCDSTESILIEPDNKSFYKNEHC